jgi:hypothetical protein
MTASELLELRLIADADKLLVRGVAGGRFAGSAPGGS